MTRIARTPGQIGQIIQRQRNLRGLSQTALATQVGLRQELISKIEAGSEGTRIGTICDLLAALDLELTVSPRSKSAAKDIEAIF
jgi:HTH-type transcriptional regulator / antitoxin HipB